MPPFLGLRRLRAGSRDADIALVGSDDRAHVAVLRRTGEVRVTVA